MGELKLQRPSLKTLEGQKNLIGAEIGVEYGENALRILLNLDIQILYLIDPYELAVKENKEQGVFSTKDEAISVMKIAQNSLQQFSSKIRWIKKLSQDVSSEIPDTSLDFVYIDGNHSYDAVYKDLQVYWEKLKLGGLFAGHDWNAPGSGVKEAVETFRRNLAYPYPEKYYHMVDDLGGRCDWWFYKG